MGMLPNEPITDTVNDAAGHSISIVDADGFHNVLYKHSEKLSGKKCGHQL